MGLTKQYIRYAPYSVFNIIGNSRAGLVSVTIKGSGKKLYAVGACEHVFIWDIKKGEKSLILEGDKHDVTALASSPDKQHLAVGYNDGTVKIFSLPSGECSITFSGHRSGISALAYDKEGMRLVSGSRDTEIIVWDIINEAGMYRLKGHKGMITQVRFMATHNILISSAKDTFVKFWDLDTQHCFRTVVGHRTEVWDFVLARNEDWLITGSSDMEIRIWLLKQHNEDDTAPAKRRKLAEELEESDEDADEDQDRILSCQRLGSIMRQGKDRVVSLSVDPKGQFLGCHGIDSTLEVFRILTEEEARKSKQKKTKKAKKRARESGQSESDALINFTVQDEIKRINSVKMASKIGSFCINQEESSLNVVALLSNNTIQACRFEAEQKNAETTAISKLNIPGHRSDVRTTCFSSDNTALLTASAETLKIWNRATVQCIRTISCDYALCSLFAPGDRHVILGTKSGKLQIFDIASAALVESVDAHQGAVWSICMSPDKRGIVSGGADQEVRFWDFELITDTSFSETSKRLTLMHTRTLKMAEDVLCVKFSPDNRLLAVSLLDNTVKVFFADTLKFFLSLYGHKLPVLCLDISSDSNLIITGSADRNVKLWGLDFGDCHKSIFAHDDSIMCLQFVPKSHMFFTGGKDGKVKQWDGDNFEQIQTLNGHHGEVWCLAVSPSGNYVVSGSHDRSLRLWEKTQEPLVMEEEKEMEREKEYEEAIAQDGEPVVAGEKAGETAIAGKKTVETVKAAERIMEALELYQVETEKLNAYTASCKAAGKKLPSPPLHVMFQALNVDNPSKYMLEVMKKIKSSELEEALLVLPFSQVTRLLQVLDNFIENKWEVELSCRCLFFLLRIHQGQITSNHVLLPLLDRLRSNTVDKVHELRDTIGFNMAALTFIQQQMKEKEEVKFFTDATDRFKEKKKKAKKKIILSLRT